MTRLDEVYVIKESGQLKPEFEQLLDKYANEICNLLDWDWGYIKTKPRGHELADFLRDFAREIEETEGEDTSDIE